MHVSVDKINIQIKIKLNIGTGKDGVSGPQTDNLSNIVKTKYKCDTKSTINYRCERTSTTCNKDEEQKIYS